MRGGSGFPGDQTLPEFGEAAVGHHRQGRADFLPAHRFAGVTAGVWSAGSLGSVYSSHLHVSGLFVPVMEPGYRAVLFQQTGHGAFQDGDTGWGEHFYGDILKLLHIDFGLSIFKVWERQRLVFKAAGGGHMDSTHFGWARAALLRPIMNRP